MEDTAEVIAWGIIIFGGGVALGGYALMLLLGVISAEFDLLEPVGYIVSAGLYALLAACAMLIMPTAAIK